MNITVKVDDVTLDTAVGQVFGYDNDSGEPFTMGDRTLADIVAGQIVDRLAQDRDRWYEMSRTVTEIKREVIREAVLPMVEEAITEPIQKTSIYGDPIGDPVSLHEVIVDEARKVITQPADQYNRSGHTVLQKIVAEQVHAAFASVVAEEVKKARAAVADQIGQQVAAAVTNAMKGR